MTTPPSAPDLVADLCSWIPGAGPAGGKAMFWRGKRRMHEACLEAADEIMRLNALWECEHETVMRLRAVLQKYKYESRLQTFEDRERFRQEADEALRGAEEKP